MSVEENIAAASAFLLDLPGDAPPPIAMCYVDTGRRLGHYTEYMSWHGILNAMSSFPQLDA